MNFTLGSDPEFMLIDSNGEYKSAIGIVPGRKEKKYKLDNYYFYYDNVLAECNIIPGRSLDESKKHIQKALQLYSNIVAKHDVYLKLQAAQRFKRSELKAKEASRVGCSTEKCAYSLDDVNITSLRKKIQKGTLRTAGGHIHLGTPLGQTFLSSVALVRMLDLFVGIPSLFIDHDPTSCMRRKLFGEAGRYRRPHHGIEYRSLSNFWLQSPRFVSIIYKLCEFAIRFVQNGKYSKLWQIDEENLRTMWDRGEEDPCKYHHCVGYDINLLRECFITGDRTKAEPLLEYILQYLPLNLTKQIEKLSSHIEEINLHKEWKLSA